MIRKILGAVGLLWGGAIIYKFVSAGGMAATGTSAYAQGQQAGQMLGMVFAICLVLAGAYALFSE